MAIEVTSLTGDDITPVLPALAKLRMAKRRRDLGEDTTDELLEIKDEDDIYDVVDESEYQSLVESRRQREDFVVDDGTPCFSSIRSRM